MEKPIKLLAFDFGASSGRGILGIFDGKKLTIEEVHRFSNDPVELRGSIHWDILRLFHEIRQGILKCVNGGHRDIASIAVDTWGVDYGLLDEKGELLGNPYHYRDSRTDGIMEEVFRIISRDELYSITGIQFMKLNTIFQLYAMKKKNPALMSAAKTMLLTPDLLNYFLTGIKSTEFSIASTTQLLDIKNRCWSDQLPEKLGLPGDIFTDIVMPGTVIGKVSPELAGELGIGEIPVVSVASHDTQSAIASVPTSKDDFIYISSGTWSLMGIESEHSVINAKSRDLGFTNEAGLDGRITFLKNIMGLWLIQECRRQWEREGKNLSFAELEKMSYGARPFESFIDPDHEYFIAPGNMPERIRGFCRNTGQAIPEKEGDIIRCIMQSLALKYRMTAEALEELNGKKYNEIYMVGGGIKDKGICQFTANATGKFVSAGPVEATAIGNILVQARALGLVKDTGEIRKIVSRSFSTAVYAPEDTDRWSEAYIKFKGLFKY